MSKRVFLEERLMRAVYVRSLMPAVELALLDACVLALFAFVAVLRPLMKLCLLG